jgi:hypothetical protein
MKYLLRHEYSKKDDLPQNIHLLDCGGTMENDFAQHKKSNKIYAIDLKGFDDMDLIILEASLKRLYKLNPRKTIFVRGFLFSCTPLDKKNFSC